MFTKQSHEHFGLMKFSLKAVKQIEPAPLFLCHRTPVYVMICWFHSAMAYKLNMTFFLLFTESKISRYDFKTSDRKCWKLFDISFFVHPCHFTWLSRLSCCLGRVHWFFHSWIWVLWNPAVSVDMPPMHELTDKWIWHKNCLGKAIPQASQQFPPSFFTSIEKAFPALGDILRPTPDFSVKLTFFFSPSQDGYIQKSITKLCTPLWTCLYVRETVRKTE